ncbi:hypothetical protein Hanom_Chr04g00304181 [Helianthus anomalus]
MRKTHCYIKHNFTLVQKLFVGAIGEDWMVRFQPPPHHYMHIFKMAPSIK